MERAMGEGEEGEDGEQEDESEEGFSWYLAKGEREIGASQWVECVIDLSLRKMAGMKPFGKRLTVCLEKWILPNACKSNTETFRGELSMEEVQEVFKNHRESLQKIFFFYARKHKA